MVQARLRQISCFLFFLCLSGSSTVLAQSDFFVATDGDDNNSGTSAEPWRTIQYAADRVVPGSTVFVRDGVYAEQITVNVSGHSQDGYVTFRNVAGEVPIIDGADLFVPDTETGLFFVENVQYIRIEGFELRNYTTSDRDRVPVGIHVRGESHHIEIIGNRIHGIASEAPVDDTLAGADAHGIAVYGSSISPIHNITIDGNEIFDLTLGSSEALVVNGNVDGFSITNNDIYDVDNIAIDCIGFEGTSSVETTDQTRNGVIRGNTVRMASSFGNPSYGDEYGAAGIYVDGGRDIVIDGNTVTQADIGIELASEHAGKSTSGIVVRNNVLFHNNIAGIALGGYDSERGRTEDCHIVNNTLYRNDTQQEGNGELLIQYYAVNNTVKNNIFYAGSQSILIENPYQQTNNNLNFNLYFAPDGAAFSQWKWDGVTYTGFADFVSVTGNDSEGLFVDPMFVNADEEDLHLLVGSPAIDMGENLPEAAEIDRDGRPRRQQGGIDIGAYEYPGPASTGVWRQVVDREMYTSIYPNPSTTTASLRLALYTGQRVHIAVFDLTGRQMALLYNGYLSARRPYSFTFSSAKWPVGLYVVQVVGETVTSTYNMIHLK